MELDDVLDAWRDGKPALTVVRARQRVDELWSVPALLHVYGDALVRLANYEEAGRVLHRALELCAAAQACGIHRTLGEMNRAAGHFDVAEVHFRRAIAAKPTHASAYIYLGGMLASLGRLPEAETLHRAATVCDEGQIEEAHLNLGLVLRAQGRFEEAVTCFGRALAIDPNCSEALAAAEDVRDALSES